MLVQRSARRVDIVPHDDNLVKTEIEKLIYEYYIIISPTQKYKYINHKKLYNNHTTNVK